MGRDCLQTPKREGLKPRVEFGFGVQQAAEAPNIVSYQMQSSFGAHEAEPGRLVLRDDIPPWVLAELRKLGRNNGQQRATLNP